MSQPNAEPEIPKLLLSLSYGAELKGDAVVGLREIFIALARFI